MKIVGSDFDGTLTCGGIGEAKLAAIRRFRQAGHKFGIISGRCVAFRETLLRQYPGLELDFFAAHNGGVIVDGEGTLIRAARCETVSAAELTAFLLDFGCPYVHVNGMKGEACGYACVLRDREAIPRHVDPADVCLEADMPPFESFFMVSVQMETTAPAAEVVKAVAAVYGAHLNPIQNGVCVDIVPLGVHKGYGLSIVMEHFGCAHDDVIAVGDNINDIDMIKAFRSYAMASGVEEVKALADGIVSDVTELLEAEL